MKNWKISRLQIQAFKAFSFVDFDFESCSLLTMEGPNGYGKTTAFDAIELLLTGEISRISELHKTVMPAAKKLYKDNLYWNVKDGEKDIQIRGEISNGDGETVFFLRTATIADLKVQSNNKADKFDIFKLYQLESFGSDELGNELPSNYLDTYFGEGFAKNYSMLNYLQQGQSTFIFAKRITERKNALEDLLKTRETRDQIDQCVKVERRLALTVSAEQQKLTELQLKIASLENVSVVTDGSVAYKKIGTREPVPAWDMEEPFSNLNEELYNSFIAQIDLLDAVLSRKTEVQVRKKNADIERFVTDKGQLIATAVSVGKHLDQYPALETQHQRLVVLGKALASLAKSPATIAAAELVNVRAAGSSVEENIAQSISDRDALLKLLDGKSSKIVELNQLRNDLLAKHSDAFGEDSSHCALCGLDWQTAEKLKQAIADTTAVYQAEIGTLSGQLQEHYRAISGALDPIKLALSTEAVDLEKLFDRALHTELGKFLSSFDELRKLNERFSNQGIDYSKEFTTDLAELASRKQDLIAKIRSLKEAEGEAPPMGWEQAISDAFAKVEDFYGTTSEQLAGKRGYVTMKHRLQQNATLQAAKLDLGRRQLSHNAAVAAKEKISQLKGVLTTTERDYSARVISNIELIFHIYSGRLIQNYQRGLGLFIDYGDGKQLQFCTAEQSAHDATLSMSSGQLSALSLAFFLSLNRVYADSAFVLIDDPAQSLDEINIASLTDLLRCELSDRQLVISSHEDNIAGYMRYRFNRAGLAQKPFHMQTHVGQTAAR